MPRVQAFYPRLVVSDAAGAIDFYRRALGATETARYTKPDGSVVHAEVAIGDVVVAVKDEDEGDPAPTTLGGSPVIMALHVDDADRVADAMVREGARVVHPVQDAPYGQRGGRIVDPYGHLWMVSQQIEDLSPEEVQRRTETMFTG